MLPTSPDFNKERTMTEVSQPLSNYSLNSDLNKFIKFPFSSSAENLFREDEIYNIVCIISYNTNPIIKNKGSAIFLHIANTDYSATAGCLALKQDDLIELLQNIDTNTKINILD